MKKALVLLLAILYVTITSGVMVNIHYCMGDVTEVSYGADQNKHCGSCGMEQKDGCCHTDHQFIKSGDQHVGVEYASAQAPHLIAVPAYQSDFSNYAYSSAQLQHAQFHSPPDGRFNSIRIYNCVFRI